MEHFHIPLTEHDSARQAFIEPSETIAPRDVPGACVITFFGDVVDRLVEHGGERLAVLRSGVGAPLEGCPLPRSCTAGTTSRATHGITAPGRTSPTFARTCSTSRHPRRSLCRE